MVVEDFLAWAETRELSRDWTLHLRFLIWLKSETSECITETMIKECLAATALRWSMQGLEHVSAKGMLVASAYSTTAAALWKSQDVAAAHTLFFLQLNQQPITACYAISYQNNNWQQAAWQIL